MMGSNSWLDGAAPIEAVHEGRADEVIRGRVHHPPIERRSVEGGSRMSRIAETHDLVLAKCARGEDRDWRYAAAALECGLASLTTLLRRAEQLPVDEERRSEIRRRPSTLSGISG
jgi:hypothetical protein